MKTVSTPSPESELVVDLYSDARLVGSWRCTSPRGAAVGLGNVDHDPLDFHSADVPQARELARAWGVSEQLAKPGPVTPAEGVSFLLAVYATYCRGSRFRAHPRRAGLLCGQRHWQFIVMGREEMEAGEAMRVAVPHVVVSIRNPGSRPVKHRTNALCRGVHCMAFHDAEPEDKVIGDMDVRLMTDRQADALWRFLHHHADDVGAVVAHCEAGMSRSPASLIAIGACVGADTQALVEEFNPNRHVIEAIKASYRRRQWARLRRQA